MSTRRVLISEQDYVKALINTRDIGATNKRMTEYIIDKILRKYTEERPCIYVSQKAIDEANSKKIELDLCNHGQFRKTCGKGIKLRWEHSNIVKDLVAKIIKGIDPNKVLSDTIVSVIAKDEDDKLNALHYRNKRDPNFLDSYHKAGIKLVKYEIYQNSKKKSCN
jgi:hypothetical protein